MVGRSIALLFHDRSTSRGWVVSCTPRPNFTLGKDPVPALQKAGSVPGSVWTGGKSGPHRDSIPVLPVRSQSLYRRSYRAHFILSYPEWNWDSHIKIQVSLFTALLGWAYSFLPLEFGHAPCSLWVVCYQHEVHCRRRFNSLYVLSTCFLLSWISVIFLTQYINSEHR